jgi:hypothetical protein
MFYFMNTVVEEVCSIKIIYNNFVLFNLSTLSTTCSKGAAKYKVHYEYQWQLVTFYSSWG